MAKISVLFVDDEEDIRQSFNDRFEDQFEITLASHGGEALEIMKSHDAINVVVTDIRMPNMDGLEMIKEAREIDPDMGFIVVSGHGDTNDVILALQLGVRNFIRKPYSFGELEEAVVLEARRYQLIHEERGRREEEKATEQFLVSLEGMTFELPNQMEWVSPITFRLIAVMEAVGLCDESTQFNLALGIMEIIANAMEHGNLELSGDEKHQLKNQGEDVYLDELAKRAGMDKYKDRTVRVSASINSEVGMIHVADEGNGFDYENLPDPTNPENLFLPSGRGILLARSFFDKVTYQGKGNEVTLVQYNQRPS